MNIAAEQSLELSRDVLGAALVQPEVLSDLRVPPEDMPDARAGAVLEAMLGLHERGERIELRGVKVELRRRGTFSRVGDEWLAALAAHAAPISTTVIDRLHELAELRRLASMARKVEAACMAGDLDGARELHTELSASECGYDRDAVRLKDLAVNAAAAVIRAAQSDQPPGLPFGMPWLERSLGTLRRGNMLALGAPTNTGKSRFVMSMLLGMCQHAPVGWISIEDPEDLIGERYAGIQSGVRSLDMRRGLAKDSADVDRLMRALRDFDDPDIYVDTLIGCRDVDVLASMRRMVHRYGVKHIVIDYVQACRSSQHRLDKKHQVSDMASQFKGTAYALDASLTLVSQVVRPQRDNPNRPPTMHDLKETGDLENASEAIVMLWPEVGDDKRKTGRVFARVVKGKTEIGDDRAVFVTNGQGRLIEQINAGGPR